MRCGAACIEVDCELGSHSAAPLLDHISLRVIVILFVRAIKLVSVEDAPSAPLGGESTHPCKLMVSGMMEF